MPRSAIPPSAGKRGIRFRTLGTGYGEDEIKAVLEGKNEHKAYQKKPPQEHPFQLLVDIQGKMAEGKSIGYKKWATKFNLKEMSKTLLFLQEQKISSADELREHAAAATERYHAMGDSIKAAEARLTEIAVLKTHIINYAKTRDVYAAYRKAGYSKAFLEAHRKEIALHKAAKAAFDEAGLQKFPKVKALDAEFAELLTKKESSLPGLPQGTERDAGTGSGTEKRGTIFCGGKTSTGERAGSMRTNCRELTVSGRFPAIFFRWFNL